MFHLWQKQFFENGAAALERKNRSSEKGLLRTLGTLREKLQRKNEVVAELMEEHIQLETRGSPGETPPRTARKTELA